MTRIPLRDLWIAIQAITQNPDLTDGDREMRFRSVLADHGFFIPAADLNEVIEIVSLYVKGADPSEEERLSRAALLDRLIEISA